MTKRVNMRLFDQVSFRFSSRSLVWGGLAAALLLGGCSNSKLLAPVEDRPGGARRASGQQGEAPTSTVMASPSEPKPVRGPHGAENVGKPGYYTVKPGDTLIRVGLETGQNWRDVARWNSVENPNLIDVGQVLRVVPPQADAAPSASGRSRGDAGRASGSPSVAPVSQTASAPAVSGSNGSGGAVTSPVASSAEPVPISTSPPTAVASGPAAAPVAVPPVSSKDDDGFSWIWPAGGSVISGFDEGKSKGVAIAGRQGDPVVASADGRVVYAGSGLRGYGNLVILKHNSTYLTAYAHNQSLLVKEDQAVRKGQKIAEMGSSDAERVQLHFEIRKQGKPIDPLKLLPVR